MAEIEQVMRVMMDENQLHRLLDPVLEEINSLRARVGELELEVTNLKEWQRHTQTFCETVHISLLRLEDDGR
jgi:hypothetical protein